MMLRMVTGPKMGELQEFPAHVGKNLLHNKFAEVPTNKEIEEWEAAIEASELPPEHKSVRSRRVAETKRAETAK